LEARVSLTILLMGALMRNPESRTSTNGKSYAFATLKVATSNEIEFWSAMAFGADSREALLGCVAGEKIALQGSPKFEVITSGESDLKVRRTLFVDATLTARPKPRERKPRPDKPARAAFGKATCADSKGAKDDRGPNDAIPF
jgi:hypothetical protein